MPFFFICFCPLVRLPFFLFCPWVFSYFLSIYLIVHLSLCHFVLLSFCTFVLLSLGPFVLKFLWPVSFSQLSNKACPNTWLPKTLTSVQLQPIITELCPAMVTYSPSNYSPQYKNIKLFLFLVLSKLIRKLVRLAAAKRRNPSV